jgi:hypothetical protein
MIPSDKEVARLLAELSRSIPDIARSERAKAGMKRKLRAALIAAVQEYGSALQLDRRRYADRRMLSSVHRDCKKLNSHLTAAQNCWSNIGRYGGKEEIARFAPDYDVDSFIELFENAISLMIERAQRCSSEEQFPRRGRPSPSKSGINLFALTEGVKVLRAFWVKEISPAFSFGYVGAHSKKARKQLNAATLLVFRSAQRFLDSRCTLGNVRRAMETARGEPMLYG